MPIGDDSIWLDGHTAHLGTANDLVLSIQFSKQQSLLANHLKVFRRRGSQHNIDY